MKTIAVIPHYRHIATLPDVVAALRAHDLPVLIVDDGSGAEYRDGLLALQTNAVQVLFLPQNGGKGFAMKAGMRHAAAQGFTHALQIDADGQHNFADIPRFLEASRQAPEALICGKPVYGKDIPKARLYGRKITDFWNMIHTWSRDIRDGMCGFRLYPLACTLSVIEHETVGNRMDFDTEILIRLYWRGIPLIWIDTAVRYHPNGISHFRSLADNWLISKMHTRLFFGMFLWKMKKK